VRASGRAIQSSLCARAHNRRTRPSPALPAPPARGVVAAAGGLTDEQARWTPDGRLLPIIGIVNHLAHVEWRWIDGRYLGHEFPPREEEFRVADELTLAGAIDAYAARAARTQEVVLAADTLEAPCLGREGGGPPAHVLLGLDQPLDLRWAVLHLIEETARHAGHADILREQIDGATAL
jgi:hypothetical protein